MRKIRISLLTFILFMMSFYVDAQVIRVLRPMGLDNENASVMLYDRLNQGGWHYVNASAQFAYCIGNGTYSGTYVIDETIILFFLTYFLFFE